MQTTVSRWGNSLALRLPRYVIEEARLVEGATVDLKVEGGTIRVTPSRKRFKLSELLRGEDEGARGSEYDWGSPAGEESW